MKIGFLSHSAMSVYHFRMPIIKALLARGDEVVLIVPKDEYAKKLEDLGFKICCYELERSSVNPFIVIKNFINLCKVLKGLNLDLIQTSAHKSNTFGIIAAKICGIKYIFGLVEGLGSFYIDNDFKSSLVRLNINFLYKIAFKLADAFIFVSPSDEKFMQNLGLKKDKSILIKSVGVNLKHFFPLKIPEEARDSFKQDLKIDDKVIVLMVARALWHKGIKEFYEAADLLKHKANFLFVGGKDDNKSCAPSDFLEQDQVFYLGVREDINFLLNLCDIFVLPSYKEGFPRTVLEAKACRKPCVVSECDGNVEAITEAIDGLFCKVADSKDLAEKIELLIDDERLRKNLGKNAYEDALNYDENLIAQKYLQVYDMKVRNKKCISSFSNA